MYSHSIKMYCFCFKEILFHFIFFTLNGLADCFSSIQTKIIKGFPFSAVSESLDDRGPIINYISKKKKYTIPSMKV